MAIFGVVGTSRKVGGPQLSVGPGCLQCALERLAGRNYCGACGNLLRPRCERKQMTVLFADVSGFTALSERLDPEQVSEIMQRTFDIVLETVHEHRGTVNQFLGDGVMALFSELPGLHHACRALRVVVGTIGAALRTDYTATGNTASAALELLQIAEPGQIVLTDRTRELAAGYYDFAEIGAMPLTESRETVIVYELARETTEYVANASLTAV